MRRLLLLLACPLLLTSALAADAPPDGRILDRRPVDLAALLADDPPARLVPRLEALRDQVEVARITYASDGLEVAGYLAVPRTGDDLPSVIFCRGGNREFGELTDLRAVLVLGSLAARGYAVVGPQYRGNDGGEGREEFGGADLDDVLDCIPLLESLDRADADRLGIYGWSRGGLMTYLALAATDRFDAAVVGGGLADSFDMLERRPEMADVYADLVPDWKTDREAALARRSPVRWADELDRTAPVLVLHGTADWRVHPTQALRMAEALLAARVPYRLVMFEGGDHGLGEHRREVDREVGEWLDRYVRDGAPLPDLEPHGR